MSAFADHLPDGKIARGRSETIVSGIDVYKSTIRQVVHRLGRPAKITDIPSTGNIAGGRDYEWQRGEVNLRLGTWNGHGDKSVAYSVEVSGPKPVGEIGTTGRGLKLGGSLADLQRIYGPRFSRTKRDDGTAQVIIQWQDDTKLTVYFDSAGHINRMHLMAATE